MTAGQEADCSNHDALMEARDSDPAIMLGDKGYDSDPIRQDLRGRGAVPEIPTKRNRHVQHSVSRTLYALRSRIERFINRLKNSRRVATAPQSLLRISPEKSLCREAERGKAALRQRRGTRPLRPARACEARCPSPPFSVGQGCAFFVSFQEIGGGQQATKMGEPIIL